jgi:CheY-like chemotaxis protein
MKKILFVDDNPMVRKIVRLVLKKGNYQVLEATDGREALDIVEQTFPNLVICDISMPGMDGREYLAAMKASEKTKDIPIIILTAELTGPIESEMLLLGAQQVIEKVDIHKALLKTVAKYLD